jgi:hypothetical protein
MLGLWEVPRVIIISYFQDLSASFCKEMLIGILKAWLGDFVSSI